MTAHDITRGLAKRLRAVPGGCLIGDDAGFLDASRIKGSHAAMKSGMLAAEAALDAIQAGREADELTAYPETFRASDIKDPMHNIVWVTPEGGGGPNYPNM